MTALPSDIADIEACEQRLVNLWPSTELQVLGPWALRFAGGYTSRANSASALWRGADLGDDDIDLIVARYRAASLPPAIRISPLAAAALPQRLMDRGWRLRVTSNGLIADPQDGWRADARVSFDAAPTTEWCAGVGGLQPEPSKRDPAKLMAIVSRIRTGAGFATIHDGTTPIGYGMVAQDRGYAEIGSIILSPAARGRGLGRALVTSMLAHGVSLGARRLFLQVESGNRPAEMLYASLGFRHLYEYREYRLTSAQ